MLNAVPKRARVKPMGLAHRWKFRKWVQQPIPSDREGLELCNTKQATRRGNGEREFAHSDRFDAGKAMIRKVEFLTTT